MNILITGATGNIGRAVIRHFASTSDDKIFAAIHNTQANPLPEHIKARTFDFYDHESVISTLKGIDVVFLLRPPHIAEVQKVFKPLVNIFKEVGIKQIISRLASNLSHTRKAAQERRPPQAPYLGGPRSCADFTSPAAGLEKSAEVRR